MRKLLVVASVVGLSGLAAAQPAPLDPYAQPVAAPGVVDPYAGPEVVVPTPAAPVAAPTPGYYYPPPGYAAPLYAYPPPPVVYVRPMPRRVLRGPTCWGGSCNPAERARFFSVGLRVAGMSIVDQQINGHNVFMGGAGLQLRFRTRGHFGIEASVDFLHGSYGAGDSATPVVQANGAADTAGGSPVGAGARPYFHVGDVTRDSIPVQISALVYIWNNTDARHFNIYLLGGLGVIDTKMGLTDEWGNSVTQEFTEFEAHLGVGAELRFRWFALQADLRGLAITRDDSSAPASFYQGVDGAPVMKNSYGVMGNIGAAIWF
jgi:hypothetical protein